MKNRGASEVGDMMEYLLLIVLLVVLAIACKYIWQGIVWAFKTYIELLKIQ